MGINKVSAKLLAEGLSSVLANLCYKLSAEMKAVL